MVKCSKIAVRRLKTAPRWKIPAARRKRSQMVRLRDGAPDHRCSDFTAPDHITLLYLPPYSPELNPKETLWDEIRARHQSITSFPYIVNSL
jgi:transposase